MNNSMKYDLISNVISFLNGEEYEASITNLSKDCNVPVLYMRKVIVALLKNLVLKSCLYVSDCEDDLSLIDEYNNSPEKTEKAILNGVYDNVIWEINFNILDNSEEELLYLSQMEYSVLSSFDENKLSLKRGSLFEKKDNINPVSKDIRKHQKTILNAIDSKRAISFTYKTKNDIIENIQCYPIELSTNITDNWLYFRSSEEKTYRLDKIVHGCKILYNEETCTDYKESARRKYAWGSYYDPSIEPVHVKVRISSGKTNVLSKIKNDIRYRKETGSLYTCENYYYYEDDIIGIPEFQRWIRSYGSSVVVIEPVELRIEIESRAKETLDLYVESKVWNLP